jgi:hypothetical protein
VPFADVLLPQLIKMVKETIMSVFAVFEARDLPRLCKAVWIAFAASSETNLRSFSKSTTVDRPNLAARGAATGSATRIGLSASGKLWSTNLPAFERASGARLPFPEWLILSLLHP